MAVHYTTDKNGKQVKKRSGAKVKRYVPTSGVNKGENQIIVNGWFFNKQKEFCQFTCITTKESKDCDKHGDGNIWLGHIACSFINRDTFDEKFYWGSMQKSTGKVVIDKIQFVINPEAPNGGYTGSFVVK